LDLYHNVIHVSKQRDVDKAEMMMSMSLTQLSKQDTFQTPQDLLFLAHILAIFVSINYW